MTTTSAGTTTSATHTSQYRSLAPLSVTVPAGQFDGVEIELTSDGAAAIRYVVAPDLGSVSNLVRYTLR